MTRIEAITRCCAEMEQCNSEASLGALIGLLDWYTELHRLLYGEEN